jgi:hypothetical protein
VGKLIWGVRNVARAALAMMPPRIFTLTFA